MRIITLATTKGGVGKSTYTALLADSFVRRGANVRLFDLDQQASVTRWATKIAERTPNLTLKRLDLADDATMIDVYNQIVASVEDEPDWVVIDTKGADSPDTLAALAISDLVLVPSGPIYDEARAIQRTLKYLEVALQLAGEESEAKDHLRVLYQSPGQFLNADMIGYRDLILDHYGALDGVPRSSAAGSFLGNEALTNEAISTAREEKRSTKALETLQERSDALAQRIEDELNGIAKAA